jgi:protein gp37
MGANSQIEWTDHTFNPWLGCQHVSRGCEECYAEDWADRFGLVQWGPHGQRKRTVEGYWRQPFSWVRWAKNCAPTKRGPGKRPLVFSASHADWLDNKVPKQWRADLTALIDATPELDWLMLTKRIELFDRLAPWARSSVPSNVWIGVTAESQEYFNRRWPVLRGINAIRFISYEPALGPLVLGKARPDWVICGGESGSHPRYMDSQWARDLRDECRAAGVLFFMKQMTGGKETPIPSDLMVRQFPRARLEAGE